MLPELDQHINHSRSYFPWNRENEWNAYRSVFTSGKETFIELLTPETLLLIHPGLRSYDYWHYDYDQINDPLYFIYTSAMRQTVKSALDNGQTVLVYTPEDKLKQTLATLPHMDYVYPGKIILVPTYSGGTTDLHEDILCIESEDEFYRQLKKSHACLTIVGEYGEKCIDSLIRNHLKPHHIPYIFNNTAIYPDISDIPRWQQETPSLTRPDMGAIDFQGFRD
jgi:hypothetical protein